MAAKVSLKQMLLDWALGLIRQVGDAANVAMDGNRLTITADLDGVAQLTPLKPPTLSTTAAKPISSRPRQNPRKPQKPKKPQPPQKASPPARPGRSSREDKIVEYLRSQGNKGGPIMKLASVAGIGKKQKPRVKTAAILSSLEKAGTIFKLGNLYRHADFPKTNRGAKPKGEHATRPAAKKQKAPKNAAAKKDKKARKPTTSPGKRNAAPATAKPATTKGTKPNSKKSGKAPGSRKTTKKPAQKASERADERGEAGGPAEGTDAGNA